MKRLIASKSKLSHACSSVFSAPRSSDHGNVALFRAHDLAMFRARCGIGDQQFFVQFLAGLQSGELNFDVAVRMFRVANRISLQTGSSGAPDRRS